MTNAWDADGNRPGWPSSRPLLPGEANDEHAFGSAYGTPAPPGAPTGVGGWPDTPPVAHPVAHPATAQFQPIQPPTTQWGAPASARPNPVSVPLRPSVLFLAIVAATAACGALLWRAERIGEQQLAFVGFVLGGWIVSLCLHEFAHALVAYLGGDRSVAAKGYLTLDPRRYTDPGLSIVLPLIFLFIGGIGLPGGAVWIDRRAIRSKGMETATSLAGPVANLVCGTALLAPFLFANREVLDRPMLATAIGFLAALQFVAATLNLLPIPGLDGFGAIAPWLSPKLQASAARFSGIGFIVLFVVAWNVPAIWDVIWYPARFVATAVDVPERLFAIGWNQFRFWLN